MTLEEFQKYFGNIKIETTIKSISKSYGRYNPKKAWRLIKKGEEFWFFNTNDKCGPVDWMKLKVTYKRCGVIFYKVLDKRYKMADKEEHADVDDIFVELLHPAIFKNTDPEYLIKENFDTLDGRIEIV